MTGRINTDLTVGGDLMRRELLQEHAEELRQATGVQFSPMFDPRSAEGTNFQLRLAEASRRLRGPGRHKQQLRRCLGEIKDELVRLGLVRRTPPPQPGTPPEYHNNRRLVLARAGGR